VLAAPLVVVLLLLLLLLLPLPISTRGMAPSPDMGSRPFRARSARSDAIVRSDCAVRFRDGRCSTKTPAGLQGDDLACILLLAP